MGIRALVIDFGEQKKEHAMFSNRQIWITTGVVAGLFLLLAILAVLVSIMSNQK